MAALFEVNDPLELNALLRVLLEGKFSLDVSPEVAGSPIVAHLCERVLEAFLSVQAAGRLPGNAEETQARIRTRPGEHLLAVVRRRLAESRQRVDWSEGSLDERKGLVRNLLSPYPATEDLVAELIAGAENT
jgi:hypothetical protein